MTTVRAAERLRQQLSERRLIRLIGAHNALGARMGERAGFDGVWSSGLELSASMGVPDSSLVTLSEHLAMLQAMTYSLEAPIVADCDTGYGDACNVAFTVRKLEAAGVAGMAIEDKCYPKRNSFADVPQHLAPVEEFAAKIESARRARRGGLMIVARTEALIAGRDPDEALRRAHAYADAGADAILFHSKERSVDRLAETIRRWRRRLPVVLVPTTYPQVDVAELERLGAQMVIYANHGLRASLRAMERTYTEILRSGSTRSVEPFLWSLPSLFALQDVGHPQNGHRQNGANGDHRANGRNGDHRANGTNGDHGARARGPHEARHASLPPVEGSAPARSVVDAFLEQGHDVFTGVPDSTLKALFQEIETRADLDYLPAVSEEAAIGYATGQWLGGRSPVVLMQNSGLGTAVTALASLAIPYGAPLVLVVGWRGVDGDDAPEHRILGDVTPVLLDLLDIPFEIFDPASPADAIARITETARRRGAPAALVVRLRTIR